MNINEEIKALVVKPNCLPKEVTVKKDLESLQEVVGGYIEYVYREQYPNVILICNEEGKLNGSSPNRDIGGDIIFGDFIIVGDDGESETSLTEEQINHYKKVFDQDSIKKTEIKLQSMLDTIGL